MNDEELKLAAHDHVLASTILPDADSQREKQRKAVEQHLAREAEKQAYLDSLAVEQPSPRSAPVARVTKFIPKTKPKRVSRIAAHRAQQKGDKIK